MAPSSRYCGGRRRYWLCRQCPVLRAGEHPQLLLHPIQSSAYRRTLFRRHGVFKHTPPSETAAAPTQFSRAMGELGVQLARSPQATGTRGHALGHGAETRRRDHHLTQPRAQRLPAPPERFRVPPEHADTAYRVLDPGMCLLVLCLKQAQGWTGNTVKYRWRTLQLLPDKSRPSPAVRGAGRPTVCNRRAPVASQQAPPRPSVLRSFDTRTVHTAGTSRYTNGVIRRSEDWKWTQWADRLRDDADRNGAARVRKTVTPRSRKPTPLQTARWKAVQKAKRKGLSVRGIARELSIHRDTARKYMNAESIHVAPAQRRH